MFTLFEEIKSYIFPSYYNGKKRKLSETDLSNDLNSSIEIKKYRTDLYVFQDTIKKVNHNNFSNLKQFNDENKIVKSSFSLDTITPNGDTISNLSENVTVTNMIDDSRLNSFTTCQTKSNKFLDENYLDNLLKPSYGKELRQKKLDKLSVASQVNKTEKSKLVRIFQQFLYNFVDIFIMTLIPSSISFNRMKKQEMSYLEDIAEKFRELCSLPSLIFPRYLKKPTLPKLTDEMLDLIDEYLQITDSNQIIVRAFNLEVNITDLMSLMPTEWLTDNVINFYLELIYDRSQNNTNLPRVQIISSFLYSKLLTSGYSSIRRWTKRRPIFNDYSMVLVPIHLSNHWCFVKIDFDRHEVLYYDSLKSRDKICLKTIQDLLEQDSLDKLNQTFNTNDWTFKQIYDGPTQLNGYDCGVFLCQTAEYCSRRVPLDFTQDQMSYFRQKMSYEILKQSLL